MKLVEILAKELKDWPDDSWPAIGQASSGELHREPFISGRLNLGISIAKDHMQAVVSRIEWQAERDRQKVGEWKRARGSKPKYETETPQRMEVRHRDGEITKGWTSQSWNWSHNDGCPSADIMAWRIISQPQAEDVEVIPNEKTSQVMDATDRGEGLTRFQNSEALMANLGIGEIIHGPVKMGDTVIAPAHPKWQCVDAETDCSVGQWHQIDGPIKWRDQIVELEAHAEDIQREIASLFAKLNAEGFQLIRQYPSAQDVASDVDMSDWRNWKAGDSVTYIHTRTSSFTDGWQYTLEEVDEDRVSIEFDDEGEANGWLTKYFKWHSRP